MAGGASRAEGRKAGQGRKEVKEVKEVRKKGDRTGQDTIG
jgi:hypothetical protein